MVPRFKAGDWDGGMVDGVRAAAQVLDGSMQPEPTDDEEDMLVGIIALLIIIGIAIFAIFLVGEAQRCPKCRKKGVKRVAQQVLRLSNAWDDAAVAVASAEVASEEDRQEAAARPRDGNLKIQNSKLL